MFKDCKITIGLTGGIAAYKAVDIVSWLKQSGAQVQVVMTEGATKIISPLTLKTLSGRPVLTDIFTEDAAFNVPHIDAAACDAMMIIPATANIMAKAAYGLADDVLSATLLATKAPLLIAPAMNINMYAHPATQANLAILRERGAYIIEPAYGRMACGTEGKGRLPDLDCLKQQISAFLQPKLTNQVLAEGQASLAALSGKNILISAGPTYEYIDAVRFIGNRSSGKMGYALAEALTDLGANISLVSGPCALMPPKNVKFISVISAEQMQTAIEAEYAAADIVIMAAAVADYRPLQQIDHKVKKQAAYDIHLVANPDILAGLGSKKGNKILVGFAAETDDLIGYAQKKLIAKNLDLIIANDVSKPGAGFDIDTNIISMIKADLPKQIIELPQMSKKEAAYKIAEQIADLIK